MVRPLCIEEIEVSSMSNSSSLPKPRPVTDDTLRRYHRRRRIQERRERDGRE